MLCRSQGLYTEMKFERPSRIQALTLPMVLTPPYRSMVAQARGSDASQHFANVALLVSPGSDAALAQAHNGSGKTTCFVLSMLSRVDANLKQPQVRCR